MPIAPDLRHHYRGPEWEATRERILERAQHCCERCGVPNRQTVRRFRAWWFDEVQDQWIAPGRHLVDRRPPAERGIPVDHRTAYLAAQEIVAQEPNSGYAICLEVRFVRIVLTIAHLNHISGDDRDENLAAWCQWCHLDYDMEKHADTRKGRKDAKRPLLTTAIAEQDYRWTEQLSPKMPHPD